MRLHRGFRLVVAIAALLAAALGFGADGPRYHWIGAWRASPSGTMPADVLRAYPSTLEGYTIRQVVRLGADGSAYRLRLDNALTNGRTTIADVRAGTPGRPPGATDTGLDRPVTFGGQASVTIPAFASVLSDPVPDRVASEGDLVISLYVASASASLTQHELASATGYVAPGDQTREGTLANAKAIGARILLSGVDVASDRDGGTIVALGDSITDGAESIANANHRWPDFLVSRLKGDARLTSLGVVNAGISGNRLLRDSAGPSALSRLPRDVLAVPNLRYVCVLEGINDIAAGVAKTDPSDSVTAADLIAGYRQIIAQVHETGAKVLLGTMTPFSRKGTAENTRTRVNQWIRTGHESDGVLDFDAALRDPSEPTRMLPVYDSGDHVHPNDAGYAAMAGSIDLDLFRGSSPADRAAR